MVEYKAKRINGKELANVEKRRNNLTRGRLLQFDSHIHGIYNSTVSQQFLTVYRKVDVKGDTVPKIKPNSKTRGMGYARAMYHHCTRTSVNIL